MFPVLFSIGPLTVSSFGFFLALSFLYATFLAWRLARAWELNEEKVLDFCLLTFFGAIIGARIFYIAFNHQMFDELVKIFLITKYPGLSLWGGLVGGGLTLFGLVKRAKKIEFWQVADLSAVGLLGGLILGNIGCLLGGCNVGIETNFLGVPMVGFLGKRFPVQIVEALTFSYILFRIWPVATHFHFSGKIVSLTLIWLGIAEFLLEFLRAEKFWGFIFAGIALTLGIASFYYLSKRDIRRDFLSLRNSKKARKAAIDAFRKSWYNQKVGFKWSAYQVKKKLRRARVKTTTPGNI